MKKRILTDVDDVLLSWLNGFASFVNQTYNMKLDPTMNKSWDIRHWLNMSDWETVNLITEFNERSYLFGCLSPVNQSVNGVKKLADEGYKFTAISACSTNESTVNLRKANLVNVFGQVFEQIICLPRRSSKISTLETFEPSFFIDDNYQHTIEGLYCGHTPICLETSHNINFKKESPKEIYWAKNWDAVVKFILKQE